MHIGIETKFQKSLNYISFVIFHVWCLKKTSTQAINVKCIEIIVTNNGGRRKTSNHPSLISLYYEEILKVHTSPSCFGKKKLVEQFSPF
jgi:hypothetical protein